MSDRVMSTTCHPGNAIPKPSARSLSRGTHKYKPMKPPNRTTLNAPQSSDSIQRMIVFSFDGVIGDSEPLAATDRIEVGIRWRTCSGFLLANEWAERASGRRPTIRGNCSERFTDNHSQASARHGIK